MKYNADYTDWDTNEGSIAQMVVCSKCSTIWLGGILTLLLLFAPDWLYYLMVLPFNVSGVAIIFEGLVYAPREYDRKVAERMYEKPDESEAEIRRRLHKFGSCL